MCKASAGYRGHVQVSSARNHRSLSRRPDRHAKGSAVPTQLLPGIGRFLRREFIGTIACRARHRRGNKKIHCPEAKQRERAVSRSEYVFSVMVGMARCAVPARVVAGGTNIQATLAIEGVAPLHAARTSQRDVPTPLNTYSD